MKTCSFELSRLLVFISLSTAVNLFTCQYFVTLTNASCTNGCEHGTCLGDDTCSCDIGFEGTTCEKPCNTTAQGVPEMATFGGLRVKLVRDGRYTMKEGDPVGLKCRGNLGRVRPSTQISVEWEFRYRGDKEWRKLENYSIISTRTSGCDDMEYTAEIEMNTTAANFNRRTFRCFLVKDGKAYNFSQYVEDFNLCEVTLQPKIYPESHVDLVMIPDTVAVQGVPFSRTPVSILCRSTLSEKQRVTLKLRHLPVGKGDSFTMIGEISAPNQPLDTLFPYLINHTILEPTCTDAGYYRCMAFTKQATKTVSAGRALRLDVNVLEYRTKMKRYRTAYGWMLKCSTLIKDKKIAENAALRWQDTASDPSVDLKPVWTDVNISNGMAREMMYSKNHHPCGNMISRTLIVYATYEELHGKYVRCYVVTEEGHYEEFASVEQIPPYAYNTIKAKAVLSISPSRIIINSPYSTKVTIICRALKSPNELSSVALGFKGHGQNSSHHRKEVTVTQRGTVVSNIVNERVSISGGLSSRMIRYVIKEVTCNDVGTYTCTTATAADSRTLTDMTGKDLDMEVEFHHSSAKKSMREDGKVEMGCDTLSNNTVNETDLQWRWEEASGNSKANPVWRKVNTSDSITITSTIASAPHGCFAVATSILTITDVTPERLDKTYRCYVVVGGTSYPQFSSVQRVPKTAASEDQSLTGKGLWTFILILLGLLLLLCLLIPCCCFLMFRRRRMKKMENVKDQGPRPELPAQMLYPEATSTSTKAQSTVSSPTSTTTKTMEGFSTVQSPTGTSTIATSEALSATTASQN